MTGLEHYQAAEALLAEANLADGEGYSADRDPGRHDRYLLEAQVHATLACAAAALARAATLGERRSVEAQLAGGGSR